MKFAIVADTHNNWANFEKAIKWIKKENIPLILHCGDIQSQEIIDDAKKLFAAQEGEPRQGREGDMFFVKGNADWSMPYLQDSMEMEIGGKQVGLAHFPDMAKKMAQSGKLDLVFYGHTHRPWEEKVPPKVKGKTCHMINPGELAGQFYKATFAVYDTDTEKLELKILEKI